MDGLTLGDGRVSDAVLVETGVPGWRPSLPVALVETHGGGRAGLEAAADLLLGRPTTPSGP